MNLKQLVNEPKGSKHQLPVFIVEIEERIASNNSPFLSVAIKDRSGDCRITMFSSNVNYGKIRSVTYSQLPHAIMLTLSVDFYNAGLSPNIVEFYDLSEEQLKSHMEDLVAPPPFDVSRIAADIVSDIELIENSPVRDLVKSIMRDNWGKFLKWPAARGMHHAYQGGLIKHTRDMVKKAIALFPTMPGIDKDMVLAAIFIHDLGKVHEYDWKSASAMATVSSFSTIGHIPWIAAEISRYAARCNVPGDRMEFLQHLVLSHHGELEWGSPVKPACEEAVLIHYLDQIDAKLEGIRQHREANGDKAAYCRILGTTVFPRKENNANASD